jgi:hypothetical protein
MDFPQQLFVLGDVFSGQEMISASFRILAVTHKSVWGMYLLSNFPRQKLLIF